MNFKNTLLLPKTNFEMRANLNQKEPNIIQGWKEAQIYQQLLIRNKDAKRFFLHDGPPYANGNIHLGHALNKILKDFIVKSKLMLGYNCEFIPGWDTHGLPIEQALLNQGIKRKEMSVNAFREKCAKYALEQINIQRNQLLRLGLFGDFNNPYITLDKNYEAKQIEIFFQMYEKGLIFKAFKPIYWSPSSESALAEAEIEYRNKRSPSIYVAMDVEDSKGLLEDGIELVIWTTTPWTIPLNLAIAVGSKISYSLVTNGKRKFIIATDLINTLAKIWGEELSSLQVFKGKELTNITYRHPFINRISPVVIGSHVTTENGTGLVHTAPSHGENDYIIGKKYNLEMLDYIDDTGHFTKACPLFAGKFYENVNKMVGDKLTSLNKLLKLEFIIHSYPHDWRTKKPVIFRATPQWFCSITKIKANLIAAIKPVKWIPQWGENRLKKMIINRNDWCISRQRVWGVPIPIIYSEAKIPIFDQVVNKHILKLFKKFGSNIWFEKSVKELLPVGYTHPKSPNNIFYKENDIMDVWFDSGSSFKAVLDTHNIMTPADLYLEGSDQYRGWFNSSLITAVATTGKAPYKQVLTHGFVLDSKNEKMSKSKGNVINPYDVIKQYGADILRLWVASIKYQADVRISDDILKQVAESYRSIRFKIRFALANLFDFTYANNANTNFEDIDKYVLMEINELVKIARNAYENYDFGSFFTKLNFTLNKISTNYFDFIKDILYITSANDFRRRQIQTVLYLLLEKLLVILAPIIPHTCEEAYTYFNKDNKVNSILLEPIPHIKNLKNEKYLVGKFIKFNKIKTDILKIMELARENNIIGKPAEAEVTIVLNAQYRDYLTVADQVILMVAKLNIKKINNFSGIVCDVGFIKINKFIGQICPRCRLIKKSYVFKNILCQSCNDIIKK